MSITVRLFTAKELLAAKSGTDKWLATLLMNKKTLSPLESAGVPMHLRREYTVVFTNGDHVTVYATDEKMAMRFIKSEYHIKCVKYVDEVIRLVTTRIIYGKEANR